MTIAKISFHCILNWETSRDVNFDLEFISLKNKSFIQCTEIRFYCLENSHKNFTKKLQFTFLISYRSSK